MGNRSTARLPIIGSVDSDWEILGNAFATSYDALDKKLLTRVPGIFDRTNKEEVNGRFARLYALCKKNHPMLCETVKEMQRTVNEHIDGKLSDIEALIVLRSICAKHGLNPSYVELAIMNINMAQTIHRQRPMNKQGKRNVPFENFIHDMVRSSKKEHVEHQRKEPKQKLHDPLRHVTIHELITPHSRFRRRNG